MWWKYECWIIYWKMYQTLFYKIDRKNVNYKLQQNDSHVSLPLTIDILM